MSPLIMCRANIVRANYSPGEARYQDTFEKIAERNYVGGKIGGKLKIQKKKSSRNLGESIRNFRANKELARCYFSRKIYIMFNLM